jgi:lipopolysaccharide export LptBFGC system permease protein LptF
VVEEIAQLQREIRSRLMNRYALSVTAPLLLLLGALLAMWLKGSLPLTIYMLAFLPSVLDLIAISAGEQLMRDGRTLGPIVMWSGNALMLAIMALAYVRLSRH